MPKHILFFLFFSIVLENSGHCPLVWSVVLNLFLNNFIDFPPEKFPEIPASGGNFRHFMGIPVSGSSFPGIVIFGGKNSVGKLNSSHDGHIRHVTGSVTFVIISVLIIRFSLVSLS